MKSKCILSLNLCTFEFKGTQPFQPSKSNKTMWCLSSACMRSGFRWLFIQKEATDGEDANRLLDVASVLLDFLSLSIFGRRSMAVWMCADMLTVLLHQLFGKGEVKATPASCFQRGVLCVYPQATIKASREPRFNHMHHSCPTETHCSEPETHSYQKSCPKLYRLITKAWGEHVARL